MDHNLTQNLFETLNPSSSFSFSLFSSSLPFLGLKIHKVRIDMLHHIPFFQLVLFPLFYLPSWKLVSSGNTHQMWFFLPSTGMCEIHLNWEFKESGNSFKFLSLLPLNVCTFSSLNRHLKQDMKNTWGNGNERRKSYLPFPRVAILSPSREILALIFQITFLFHRENQ